MDNNEIRQTWREAAGRAYRPSADSLEEIYRSRKMTSLDELAARYRRFSIMGLSMMIVMGLLWPLSHAGEIMGAWRYVVAVSAAIYFGLGSSIDWWLYKGVSSIDCYTMTVSEVADKAMYYRKRHLQSMILLIPFAIAMVCIFAKPFISDQLMITTMIIGVIIGLVIGYRQFTLFMASYRNLKRD